MNDDDGTGGDELSLSGNRAGWRLLVDQVKRQRKGVAVGVLVGLCWTLGKVTVPVLVSIAIDQGIEARDLSVLLPLSLAIGFAGLVAAIFTGLRRYFAFREARRLEATLRDRLFAHVQRMHFAYHDETQTGELMSRGNTDLQQVQNFIVMIPITISNAVTVLLVTIILLFINPLLALLALGSLPFVNFLGRRFSTNLHPAVMGIQRESAELASVVEETVAGVRVIKGFGAEKVQAGRLRKEADDVYEVSMDAARVRATYLPAMELLPNIGLIATLAYGGHLVINGGLSLGELVLFNFFVIMLIWPLRMLGMIVAQAQRAVASAERVAEVLSAEPIIVDDPDAPELVAPRGEVRFEDVTFGYANGDGPVLEHLELVIPAGQSVALVGATGSGKTTIARLIPRFYDVQGGRVLIDGTDVRDARLRSVRRTVGIVFEDTFLFSDTISANIAFADPDADHVAVERAARLAGAHDFILELPDGYRTEIGERGFSLSGGQRQRIAIARAILADPRVLILDDATSSVDPTKEHEIRDALEEVMTDRTTIVIAHRPATIALADQVALLDRGRIIAQGTHVELLANDARYREVLAAVTAGEVVPSGVPADGDGLTAVEPTGNGRATEGVRR
ncbi:MAG TPA: ABC transporter ATP-binding protein [Acidimicrobiales bacterium]|nr:ABC transporter ATP-binding protein [Acidimicrobiales bacterium]